MALQKKTLTDLFPDTDQKIINAVIDFLAGKRAESAAKKDVETNKVVAVNALTEKVKYPILLVAGQSAYEITPGTTNDVSYPAKVTKEIERLLAEIKKLQTKAVQDGTATISQKPKITVSAR